MANWIAGAISHPGALKAKAKADGESTREFAEAHKHDSGTTGSQARLGLTLMGMHHPKMSDMIKKTRKKK